VSNSPDPLPGTTIAAALGVVLLVLRVVAQFAPVTVDGVVERCTPKVPAALSTAQR
jgi:hypothetical protein